MAQQISDLQLRPVKADGLDEVNDFDIDIEYLGRLEAVGGRLLVSPEDADEEDPKGLGFGVVLIPTNLSPAALVEWGSIAHHVFQNGVGLRFKPELKQDGFVVAIVAPYT